MHFLLPVALLRRLAGATLLHFPVGAVDDLLSAPFAQEDFSAALDRGGADRHFSLGFAKGRAGGESAAWNAEMGGLWVLREDVCAKIVAEGWRI